MFHITPIEMHSKSLAESSRSFFKDINSLFQSDRSIRAFELYQPLETYLVQWIETMSKGLEVLPEVEKALSSFYQTEFDSEDLDGIHQGAVSELNLQVFASRASLIIELVYEDP